MPEPKVNLSPTVEKVSDATTEKQAAVAGAQAVADAVGKVAAAAVAEVQKVKMTPDDNRFLVTGVPGGRFEANGSGFSTNGTMLINGQMVATTAWGSTRIEGFLPAGVKNGDEVTIIIDKDTQLKGVFRG